LLGTKTLEKDRESHDQAMSATNAPLQSALVNSATHFRSAVNGIKSAQSSFSKEQLERIDDLVGRLTEESLSCVTNSSKQLKTEKINALKLLKNLSFTHSASSSIEEINTLTNIESIRSGRASRVGNLLDELKSESLTQGLEK
jgi:hypothetical protein